MRVTESFRANDFEQTVVRESKIKPGHVLKVCLGWTCPSCSRLLEIDLGRKWRCACGANVELSNGSLRVTCEVDG